jgi:response regulator of citrate/malate metabolism
MPVVSNPTANQSKVSTTPIVLVVDDERDIRELSADIIHRDLPSARVVLASSIKEARRVIDNEAVQLLIADVQLPDGDGTTLLPHLKERRPEAGVIVMAGAASIEQSVSVFRNGAIDYLPKPFNADQFGQRVVKAVQVQNGMNRNEKRISRLRSAVRKLNTARRMVSKKVDLLCNDLVTAYGDLARQFEDVRVRENFRQTVNSANDLEQMLCHTMDWILRQAGYTNIGIYLAGDDGTFELGAYMKYTIQGSKSLTDSLKVGIVEQILRDDFVHYTDREAAENLTPGELDHIPNYSVMGVNTTYLGESLGVMVLFRDGKTPFSADDVAMIKAIAPLFAYSLTNIAKREDMEDAEPIDEAEDAGEFWPDDEPKNDKPKREKKKDDADWWKRGEPPPF